MPDVLEFCRKHHWQHLNVHGICLWCQREREMALLDRQERLAAQVTEESLVDREEYVAGVQRMLDTAPRARRSSPGGTQRPLGPSTNGEAGTASTAAPQRPERQVP